MENNYDKWSREELLYEVKRLSVELEKVKQLKRLTDDRFVGDGFYQPKTKEERKEIQDMCDKNLYIKTNSKVESLNVGVACSILLYELG